MGLLKNHTFWIGVLVGYLVLMCFPQLNVRAAGVKASVGRS
jgi:hypothetical protein